MPLTAYIYIISNISILGHKFFGRCAASFWRLSIKLLWSVKRLLSIDCTCEKSKIWRLFSFFPITFGKKLGGDTTPISKSPGPQPASNLWNFDEEPFSLTLTLNSVNEYIFKFKKPGQSINCWEIYFKNTIRGLRS